MRAVTRVLKPGGIFLGCRQHVIDNKEPLEMFLRSHPVYLLAGTENAYQLSQYEEAIYGAFVQHHQCIPNFQEHCRSGKLSAECHERALWGDQRDFSSPTTPEWH
jgi:hypothetical protein